MTLPRGAQGGAHPYLPVSALLGGALALVVGAAWLLADPAVLVAYLGSPRAVALTHVFTLLYATLVYVGTLQQLPAVLLVTDLAWKRLGLVAVPLLALGAGALVWGFASGFAPLALAAGGAAVTLALGLVAAQTLATARSSPPRDPAGRGLVTAVCYLFAAVALGTLLAAARGSGTLATAVGYPAALHQVTGLAGAFLLGIAAAGHKLLAMFALAKGGSAWRVTALAWLVHACFAASLVAAVAPLLGWPAAVARTASAVATLALSGAGALQFIEVGALLGRRLRKRLEPPVARYVLAHAFLPLAGLLLALGHVEAATVALLLGFVGMAVSGMLVKILSFLTWTTAYGSSSLGAAPPPLLRDLSRPRLEPVITAGLGIGALAAALAVAASSPALATFAAAALCAGSAAQLWQSATVVARTLWRSPVHGACAAVTTR